MILRQSVDRESGPMSFRLIEQTTRFGITKKSCRKFIVTLDDGVFDDLQHVAKGRDLAFQELLRAIVIPDRIECAVVEYS
ncbi:hypothetical protein E6H27_07575 [Candidatus Bathyarchaeota archaeon]|nr:MAG: hypothetical protein E6H27_07575 [Candidatus Bathyarchaeota archaeon]